MTLNICQKVLLFIATGAYFLSATGYILYLFIQKDRFQHTAFGLVCSGALFHVLAIGLATFIMGTLPVYDLHQNLSIAALALALSFIVLRFRFNLKILGIFTTPLVLTMMIAALFSPEVKPEADSILRGFWLISHILLIFTGEAALALACGAALLYLVQERAIKLKRRGFFYKRLPSLDLLDSTSYSCLITGFTMLTMGLIMGLVYAKSVWGRFWDWDPKEIWSAVAWLVYAAILHGRLTSGWQGRRSAIMTIVGFAVLVFTFLGVNLLIGGHHQIFTK
ncbi:c-type cytochrome biogenesis protein CcsB [Desulforapulum autotrophicum]|uniref:c-type cytochrome biogenesis protein CcsB n=1 Tax=Desulforapulum autotrophicum TaxID=2296 RepID=UPI0003125577|nr:c-type cytochrome biogenesis protein CcsB [Desulforapulum autotrophicum]